MEEKYKNKKINPSEHTFCFTFGSLDCYKLATGRCTFDLSEEEYNNENDKCNANLNDESRVGYCREIYKSMLEEDAFSKPTGIWAYKNSCGHITFSDGQHRSCIAKRNGISELHFNYLGDNGERVCPSCYDNRKSNPKESLLKTLLKSFKKEKEDSTKAIDITYEELFK